jgi:hypothetical protein
MRDPIPLDISRAYLEQGCKIDRTKLFHPNDRSGEEHRQTLTWIWSHRLRIQPLYRVATLSANGWSVVALGNVTLETFALVYESGQKI